MDDHTLILLFAFESYIIRGKFPKKSWYRDGLVVKKCGKCKKIAVFYMTNMYQYVRVFVGTCAHACMYDHVYITILVSLVWARQA